MLMNPRFSIARLMGVVLVAGVGFAALRNSSEEWAGAMLLLAVGAVMLAAVGVLCRGPGERAGWLGFSLFGGGYLALANEMAASPDALPTITLVKFVALEWGRLFAGVISRGEGWNSISPTDRILHCLWALALAGLGSLLARVLVPAPAPAEVIGPDQAESGRPSRLRWIRPAAVGLAGFFLLALAATVGRWPGPGLWAGASFLLTCTLLGTAALGAAFGRGPDRPAWLGADLFGFGYLALTFGQSTLFIVAPHLPTEGMINGLLRPGGPPVESGFPDYTTSGLLRVRDRMIRRKLDQLIPMPFSQETPLDEVLQHIKDATREANFPGIPIYIDPVGMQKAERTLSSTVQMEVDAIPARDALHLCLKQLGLSYTVRSGFLMISDEDSATIPVYGDPVQVVGHSALALVAAGLGAVAGLFVAGRPHGRAGASSGGPDPSEG